MPTNSVVSASTIRATPARTAAVGTTAATVQPLHGSTVGGGFIAVSPAGAQAAGGARLVAAAPARTTGGSATTGAGTGTTAAVSGAGLLGSSTSGSISGVATVPATATGTAAGDTVDPSLLKGLIQIMGANALPFDLDGLLGSTTFAMRDDAAMPAGVDGFYDPATGAVTVRRSMMTEVTAAATLLRTFRAQRDSGGPIDPKFTEAARDQARHTIGTVLPLLAHEATHGQQYAAQGDALTKYAAAGDLPGHVRAVELPAIRVQEQIQLALHQPPREGTWMTLDASGAPLSDDAAVANILREHGSEIAGALAGGDTPGFKFPGFKFPGFKFPGFKFPGSRQE
ncbi:MAG: hypothetical protein JWM98_2134 [Thermoleophilia bacterium]|nr:hypothetical protein [Thermoleophilia bacterium]